MGTFQPYFWNLTTTLVFLRRLTWWTRTHRIHHHAPKMNKSLLHVYFLPKFQRLPQNLHFLRLVMLLQPKQYPKRFQTYLEFPVYWTGNLRPCKRNIYFSILTTRRRPYHNFVFPIILTFFTVFNTWARKKFIKVIADLGRAAML